MSHSDSQSIAGGWLGTYYYRSLRALPCRFEATFSRPGSDGRFTGSILDDGPLGAAGVTGVQQGRQIRFTKSYVRPRPGSQPVEYEGTLSEDGRLLKGTWSLRVHRPGSTRPSITHGIWEAHREWEEAEEPQREPEAIGQVLELVGAGR